MEVKNIVVVGRRNVGKSSLVNMLVGQQVAIVSDVAGTTADPVRKRMEITGVGACNVIDTAGIDDVGELGEKRVERSLEAAGYADLALLVFTGGGLSDDDRQLIEVLKEKGVPFILVHNQEDIEPLSDDALAGIAEECGCYVVRFSCTIGGNVDELLGLIANVLKESEITVCDGEKAAAEGGVGGAKSKGLLDGIVSEGDRVLFVCPIDGEAPEGRLILPEVMGIRSVLDNRGVVMVCQPGEVLDMFPMGKNTFGFKLVVCDSQAFKEVASVVPSDVPLGSFSILLARLKGPFEMYLSGVKKISSLCDGDRVLILESCSHRATCEDIGRVKIPALMRKVTGKRLEFEFVSGVDSITNNRYALVVQCGGCVVTQRVIRERLRLFVEMGVPVTNYGLALAYMNGLFEVEGFKRFLRLLTNF
ncbi:MAG: [FeFe] hydrogenase H-cluster maturation GTPase HydF [Bacteroidales bacterium]|nr:[FeFe] hydrogenase H-cluster maturation GTPase HydF [Bacteroidales bacterium]